MKILQATQTNGKEIFLDVESIFGAEETPENDILKVLVKSSESVEISRTTIKVLDMDDFGEFITWKAKF